MNGPENILSNDSPNEYGAFPSIASGQVGPKYRRGEGAAHMRCPFAIPGTMNGGRFMQITELRRSIKQSGENIAEFDTEKIHVRLIDTYSGRISFDDLLYIIACNKLAERLM
jgi:hypothetical protein